MDNKRNLHSDYSTCFEPNDYLLLEIIYMYIQNKKLWFNNNNLVFSNITLLCE